MSTPQTILTSLSGSSLFITLTIIPGQEGILHEAMADFSGLQRSVSSRTPGAGPILVTGIGHKIWDKLFSGPRPKLLHDLPVYKGKKHASVSTAGDVLFHIRARSHDLCFELSRALIESLEGAIGSVDEVRGFRYYDERDLLGFVEGTENPVDREAWDSVFTTAKMDDESLASGSYAVVQKYTHNMKTWQGIGTDAQENAVGRTKLFNIEQADGVKLKNAHTALTVIEDEAGVQLKIMRFNMGFGSAAENLYGTYFMGYAKTPLLIEKMLSNMFIGDPPGNYDRLLDFSTAVTGSLYFIPSQDFMDDPPDMPGKA